MPCLSKTTRPLTNPSAQLATQMVRDLVQQKQFSLARIAGRCGVSTSTVFKIHAGLTTAPRTATFNRLLILYHRVFFFPVSPGSTNQSVHENHRLKERPIIDDNNNESEISR